MVTHKFKVSRVFMYAFLVLLLLLSVVPFYLVMVNSTHSSFDIVTQSEPAAGRRTRRKL